MVIKISRRTRQLIKNMCCFIFLFNIEASLSNNSQSLDLDIDNDGNADALTDGLLILRHAFGLRGSDLTNDAVALTSSLSTNQIESELQLAQSILDIDNNGQVDALTDGLLFLRYLFGLNGNDLIGDAVAINANRSTAAEIVAYIEQHLPGAASSPPPNALSKLKIQGSKWVDNDGNQIALKGTNLGNWLLQEFWMMNQSANTVATDQCKLEQKLDQRFGFTERERLMDVFRDNWITERDWNIMQDFDLNVVRVPFIWNLIEDENNPYTLRSDAWQYLDYAIENAESHGMYVILDLHGAVGAQGEHDHSGCAGQNLYWSNNTFKQRTVWLWEKIAERYKDNNTVAAYGLLNEPWGTTASTMASSMIEIHNAIREIDEDKIIIFPGHNSGIGAYGNPSSIGSNLAFDMHFYPGIFGWGEPGYDVHRDWLTCGEYGTTGTCEWDSRMKGLNAPLLVGEFQPWANLGAEFGAANARATYDRYAELGWASTNWSYKVLTGGGGQGAGTWGMVTNKQEAMGLIAKSSTWVCAGWDGNLTEACELNAENISLSGDGPKTYYLVVKFGACCGGRLDVSLDNLSLKSTNNVEVITNGTFGSSNGWQTWNAAQQPVIQFNTVSSSTAPSGASGGYLRMSGTPSNSSATVNGGIYQQITLQGGESYVLSGVFKDNNSSSTWAEVYIVNDEPQNGTDIVAEESIPSVDFAAASKTDIEALFTKFGTVEYEVHQPLLQALTSNQPSTLYTLPAKPTGLWVSRQSNGVILRWDANSEPDLVGYNIYRRQSGSSDFIKIAENVTSTSYFDGINLSTTYYYKIEAVDAEDTSYSSAVISSN